MKGRKGKAEKEGCNGTKWSESQDGRPLEKGSVRACVRACSLGTINERIACASSRTSGGRSSSAPPLWRHASPSLPVSRLRASTA